MKKAPIFACALATTLMMAGCQESKVDDKIETVEAEAKTETVETKAKVEKSEEAAAPSLEKEEVSELIFSTLKTIESTLDNAWDENGWNSSAEADLNVFKQALKDVASEEFVDTQIKEMMDTKYYEGTCIEYIPFSIRTDIKLDIKQEKQTLVATTFKPETELDSGALYTFTFNYVDEKWILQKWTSDSLMNLGLTKEETQLLLESRLSGETVSFVEEKQTDKGKVFVFSLGGDATLTFNPNTTEYTEDIPAKETDVNETITANKEQAENASVENVDYDELDAKADKIVRGFKREESSPGTIKSSSYYGSLLYSIQDYMNNVDGYQEQEFGKWAGQYPFSKAEYILVDNVLNEMWGILKNDLEPSEFETLKTEQIQWLKEIEADAKEAEKSVDNELMGKVYYYSFLHGDTIERCRELINTYFIYEY